MASPWKSVRKVKSWHILIYAIAFTILIFSFLHVFRRIPSLRLNPTVVVNNHNFRSDPQDISIVQAVNHLPATIVIILCNDGRRKAERTEGQKDPDQLSVSSPVTRSYSGNGFNKTDKVRSNHLNYRVQRSNKVKKTNNNIIARDFDRQINQTVVLLKSIAIQQLLVQNPVPINILLLSDKHENYQRAERVIQSQNWDAEYLERIRMTFVPVSYPEGSAWMRRLFRPCATLRLFLADLLPSVDSVIYLDTDLIFLRPVTDLWTEFSKFSLTHLAAMAPCLNHYGSSANSVPYYGKTGLNAGVMLMNLTRIRESKWTSKLQAITTEFQGQIKLADQDILNIYFHSNPWELHELTCDWNFRPFQCRRGSFCLDFELSQGISALHGNALSFTRSGPEPMFHSVFSTFENHNMTDSSRSIKNLVPYLWRNVMKVQRQKKVNFPCVSYGAFPILLLNRMNKIWRSRRRYDKFST